MEKICIPPVPISPYEFLNFFKVLIFSDPELEYTARLFQFSNAKGFFHVEEIVDFSQEVQFLILIECLWANFRVNRGTADRKG